MDDLAAGVLMLAGTGEGDREDLAVGFGPEQVDRRVLHRQFRAEVAVDPLHRRLFVRDRALGDEVEDVLRSFAPSVTARELFLATISTTAECSESDSYTGAVQPSM